MSLALLHAVGRRLTAVVLIIYALPHSAAAADNAVAAAEARLTSTVQYLASDELEGRGVDTKGINLAADYIAQQFHDIGLKTDLFDGTPFQKFKIYSSGESEVKKRTFSDLQGPSLPITATNLCAHRFQTKHRFCNAKRRRLGKV